MTTQNIRGAFQDWLALFKEKTLYVCDGIAIWRDDVDTAITDSNAGRVGYLHEIQLSVRVWVKPTVGSNRATVITREKLEDYLELALEDLLEGLVGSCYPEKETTPSPPM